MNATARKRILKSLQSGSIVFLDGKLSGRIMRQKQYVNDYFTKVQDVNAKVMRVFNHIGEQLEIRYFNLSCQEIIDIGLVQSQMSRAPILPDPDPDDLPF